MDQRAKFGVNPIPPEDRQEHGFPYPAHGSHRLTPPVRYRAPGARPHGRPLSQVKGTGVEYHALAGFRAVA